jgi:hypothetical protein
MNKLKLNYLIAREWAIEKWNGGPKDKFVLGLILMAVLIVTAKIIGFIIN